MLKWYALYDNRGDWLGTITATNERAARIAFVKRLGLLVEDARKFSAKYIRKVSEYEEI